MEPHETIPLEPPPEPPGIPKRELWICLLLPIILTLGSNLVAVASGIEIYTYRLWFLPLVVGPITGFICTPWFIRILKTAYQGRSMVLMSIGYAFGQLIVTPIVGFGGCFLTASTFA